MIVVATTTWNSEDIIARFLRHYLDLGASEIIVTDYASTDSTLDILSSAEWGRAVRVLQLAQLGGKDTSRDMLAVAKQDRTAQWALFCDPDEYLITPNMRLDDLVSYSVRTNAESLRLQRFNMTALKSKSQALAQGEDLFDVFSMRIARQHARSQDERSGNVPLATPWIFSSIGPKTFCNLSATTAIASGDHFATTTNDRFASPQDDIRLLHFPFRSFEQFDHKLKLAALDFAANHYPGDHSWQYKLWFRCVENNEVYREYIEQFIDDDCLPGLIADGSVCEDTSLAEFSRRQAGQDGRIGSGTERERRSVTT
jgi:glycosyltransferase involved in cell wall biosynthesis